MQAGKAQQLIRGIGWASLKYLMPRYICKETFVNYPRCLTNIHQSQYHTLHKHLKLLCHNKTGNFPSLSQTRLTYFSDDQSGNFVIDKEEQSTKIKTETLPDGANELDAAREELNQMRELGKQVPDFISDADLEYYASVSSKRGKKKFLSFLCKRETLRKKEKMKKLGKKKEPRSKNEDNSDDTLPVNRLLRRISNVTILTGENWRLASAMKFGPQIAFDFSYDEHMGRPEVVSMVSQLNHVLNANKLVRDPFYMHWTGLKEGSKSLKEMRRMFGDNFDNVMVNVTDKDVLDIFPSDKLIFLTADSANIMHTFDIDKVYVIGGLVDSKTIQTGMTLAKAKRHNIGHARFPLDLYLQWQVGAKALTLDQVARILHSMHETQDWTEALKNVPIRKHGGFKVSGNVSPEALEKFINRPDLEKYYNKMKEGMELKKGRKESMVRDSSRFSFSRAKREFKWDLLDSDGTGNFKEDSKEIETSDWMKEEESSDFDPTGDTLFSSSEKVGKMERPRDKGKRKQSKWYH